jgi:peptidoglycan/LPS O-acetylase OafA/YrhL
VQGWNTLPSLSWNGLAWFVSVEWAMCLIFPLLLWLAKPQSGQTWRGVALIAAGLGGLLLLLFHSRHGLDITFKDGILRGLCDFTIGMGMAVLFRRWRHAEIRLWVHHAVQALLILALAWSVTRTGWAHTRNDIYTVLPIFGLILALAFDKGFLAQALHTRLPQRLGEWSYAIYIGQTAWLQAIRFFEQRLYPPADAIVWGQRFGDLIWWLEPLGLVIVCTMWGALLAEYLEFPAARWLRKRFGRRLDPQSVPTPS